VALEVSEGREGSVNFVSQRGGRGTVGALRLVYSLRIRAGASESRRSRRIRILARGILLVFASYTHTCANRCPKIRGMRFPLIPRRAANPHADSASGRRGVATVIVYDSARGDRVVTLAR
jgi:hypothetical protein